MGDEYYNEDGNSGDDHFVKTDSVVKRMLPSLFSIKVVCFF